MKQISQDYTIARIKGLRDGFILGVVITVIAIGFMTTLIWFAI